MTRTPAAFAALLLAALAFGCGEADPSSTPTAPGAGPEATPTSPVEAPASAPTFYKDVLPILQESCHSCHLPGGSAPLTLETYEEVKGLAPLVADAVANRRMPPWGLDGSGACNSYVNGRWLQDADIATLVDWASGYRAEGDPADAPPAPDLTAPSLASIGATLDMGEAYAPNTSRTDDYRCFVVDPGTQRDGFLTGFEVHPGNDRIVHHVLLYDVMTDDGVATAQALDAAEPGPGYTCFGTPRTPIASPLAAWAPGTPAQIYPEGTGLRVSKDRKLVIQVHYNMLAYQPGDTDRTTIDLQLVDRVDSPAVMMFVGDFDMVLPARDPDAWTFWEGSMAEVGLPVDTSIYGIFPHQHTLGTQLELDFFQGDDAHCFSRVRRWDFNWQQTNFFTRPVTVGPDDRMRITCRYNTLDRDSVVPWGDGTQDEMCLAVLYLTLDTASGAARPEAVGDRVNLDQGDAASFGAALPAAWSTSFSGRSVTAPTGLRITADGGSVVAVDTENATMRLGGEVVSLPGAGDGLLLRLDAAGDLMWHRAIGGPGDDGLAGVALDDEGHAFVLGWMESALTLGDTPLPYGGARSTFVARFSPDGEPEWAVAFPGEGTATPRKIAVGPDGSVAVGLYFYDSVTVGDRVFEATSGGTAGLVVWLSPEGEVRAADLCTSDESCQVRAVAFSDGGDLLVGGRFTGSAEIAGQIVRSAGSWDGFLTRLTPAGEASLVLTFGDRAWDYIDDVEPSGDGGAFLTGRFAGALNLGAGAPFHGGSDAFIARLNADDTVDWVRSVGGVAGDYGSDVVADGQGGVWAAIGREGPVDAGGGMLIRAGGRDVALVHLDAEGGHVSSQHVGGIAGDNNPTLDTRGDALLLGWTAYGEVQVDGRPAGGGPAGEALLLKLGR